MQGQCDRCLRIPLFEEFTVKVILPGGEERFFCSWECLAKHAASVVEAENRLRQQVREMAKHLGGG